MPAVLGIDGKSQSALAGAPLTVYCVKPAEKTAELDGTYQATEAAPGLVVGRGSCERLSRWRGSGGVKDRRTVQPVKRIDACVASQNGLFFDAPQRHSVTRLRGS